MLRWNLKGASEMKQNYSLKATSIVKRNEYLVNILKFFLTKVNILKFFLHFICKKNNFQPSKVTKHVHFGLIWNLNTCTCASTIRVCGYTHFFKFRIQYDFKASLTQIRKKNDAKCKLQSVIQIHNILIYLKPNLC